MPPVDTILTTAFAEFRLVNRGKVRDLYDTGEHLLLVATDRLSAFDVILPDPIPGKGVVLTSLSNFWFDRLAGVIPNHLHDPRPWATHPGHPVYGKLKGRAVLVKKAEVVPLEAVVRGYLAGSGWSEYRTSGTVCGIRLPAGLQESSRLPEPIFTPATKAPQGEHDENVSFEEAARRVGTDLAGRLRDAALALYREAAAYALGRGIIIADTKFEFGLLDGKLIVIDEALTPDSSRFWPADAYAPGRAQASYDKQFVRDWLLDAKWDKQPPAPQLPPDIIAKTSAKYREALARLAPGHEALAWLPPDPAG